MAKSAKTVVDVVELGSGKLLFIGVLTKEQLEAVYNQFEPLSRSWRGQYQSLARAVVEAYNNWQSKGR